MGIWDDSFDAEHLIADLATRFAKSSSDTVMLKKDEFKSLVSWLDSFLRWAGSDMETYKEARNILLETTNSSLCDRICAQLSKIEDVPNGVDLIIRAGFDSLESQDVARVLCGWRNSKPSTAIFDDLSTVEQQAYLEQAQSVLNLIRREE